MIKLLTYNVKMLPGPLGGGAEDLERATLIALRIIEMLPDIVCLQEVFDEDARDVLFQNLRDEYPHIVKKADNDDPSLVGAFRQDSGLFVASRHPITNDHFQPFFYAKGADAMAHKGILLTRFVTHHGPICVVNTHLQADYKEPGEHDEIRHWQIKQVARAAESFRQYYCLRRVEPIVFCGDMNVIAEESQDELIVTAEYLRMLRILDCDDAWRIAHPETVFAPTTSWDKSVDDPKDPAQRVDYILTPVGGCLVPQSASIVEMGKLSDHFAVTAELAVLQ